MPIDVTQGEADGLTVWIETGVVTGTEIIRANEGMYGKAPPGTHHRQLLDYSEVERFDVDNEEVRRIAEQDLSAAANHSSIRIAVVGLRDQVFGLARMWEVYVEGANIETKVFRSLSAAREWLVVNGDGGL